MKIMSLIRTFLQVSIVLGTLQLSFAQDNDSCGGEFESDSGTITSPGYSNGAYFDYLDCTWTIKVSSDKHIQYTIEDFDVEYKSDCAWDSLIIEGCEISPKYCLHVGSAMDNSPPTGTQVVPNNDMSFVFHTDFLVVKKGFKISWVAISKCGGCANEGICVSADCSQPYCTCVNGWTGDNCEISPCESNSCENGGTCEVNTDSSSGYVCACVNGWTGINCGTSPCDSDTCKNDGTCAVNEESSSGYVCTCVNGWTGNNCGRSPCESNPCENGGTCEVNTESSTGYVCTCTGLWSADSKCGSLDKKKLTIFLLLLKLLQEQNRCKTFEKKYPLEYKMYYRKYNCPKPQKIVHQMAYILPPAHTTG